MSSLSDEKSMVFCCREVLCCVCVVGVGLFFASGGGLFCNNTQKIMLCDIIFFFDIQKKNYWSHNFL